MDNNENTLTPAGGGEPTDSQLIDLLAENSWDLRCFDMPTGAGDADIGWQVVGHFMGAPKEREIGVAYRDDPREALRAAYAYYVSGASLYAAPDARLTPAMVASAPPADHLAGVSKMMAGGAVEERASLEELARGLVDWWDSPHVEHEAFIVANLQTWIDRIRAALSNSGAAAPTPQARMLTEDEMADSWGRNMSFAPIKIAAAIRKFCQVNGIRLSSEGESGGGKDE